MGSVNRSFPILLILILVVSILMMAKPAFAQTTTPTPSSTPTPSVPEFSIAIINSSYSVPAIYSTNPYTGQTVT